MGGGAENRLGMDWKSGPTVFYETQGETMKKILIGRFA